MMQNVGAPNYMQQSPMTSAINAQIYNPQAMQAPQPQQMPMMMPGVQNPIYNYPQNSFYQPQGAAYPQGYGSGATTSAVNIQIFEPKAYATPQQPQMPMMPQMPQTPYMMPQSPYMAPQAPYMMPQTPYMMPQMPMMPQIPQPVMQPVPTPLPVQTPIYQLPEQQMPAPTLPQEQPAVDVQAEQPAPAQPEQQAPAVDIVQPTEPSQAAVDVNALVSGLQSQDTAAQEDAITKIANLSQGDPDMQNAVLSEPVMMGLADIIRQDTSNLQGPSEAQIAAINKAASGEQLTPEEQALANELPPKTAADKNRVIAMFTLAMLQKNQRDEIDRYNETQAPANQLPQLNVNDLIGYGDIEKAARNDGEKEVKLAAIQALSYIARPEDKAAIEPVLQTAMQDPEPLIQEAAAEALTNIGSTVEMPQAAAQQEQPVDVSQMSRKEKKAYQKAQKQAAKAEKQAAKQAAKAEKQAAKEAKKQAKQAA